MKRSIFQFALIAAALLLSAGLSSAADKQPGTAAETKSIGGLKSIDAAKATEKSGKAKDTKAAAKRKLVDINNAAKKELKTLPGIGDAEADKIVAGRPYLVKAELATRSILPRGVYENLKTMVIAKQKQNPVAKPSPK